MTGSPLFLMTGNCIKLCAIFRPLHNRPNKPVYDVYIHSQVLHGKQMAACELIMAAHVPWWLTILVTQVCTEFMLYASSSHRNIAFQLWFETVVFCYNLGVNST